MRGHIKSRGKNSYSVVLDVGIDTTIGKRKQQWITVKESKKDAEKKLSELLHHLDTLKRMVKNERTHSQER